MVNKFSRWVNRELWVLTVMLFVSVFWYALMTWAVPFIYEYVSRFYSLDYSYLWNGVFDKVRKSAPLAFYVLAVFYIFLAVGRILKTLWGLVYREPTKTMPSGPLKGLFSRERLPVENVLLREFGTAFIIIAVCCLTLMVSRDQYMTMKRRYFSETVSTTDGFQNLTDREKSAAITQFDNLGPDAVLPGLLSDKGFHAKTVFRLQHLSFWLLIWGYPSILVLRTILWALKVWREEL